MRFVQRHFHLLQVFSNGIFRGRTVVKQFTGFQLTRRGRAVLTLCCRQVSYNTIPVCGRQTQTHTRASLNNLTLCLTHRAQVHFLSVIVLICQKCYGGIALCTAVIC